jgi:hypothetical protein
MAASLTRAVTFHALHRYYRPEWTETQNREALPEGVTLKRVRIAEDPTLYADCTRIA